MSTHTITQPLRAATVRAAISRLGSTASLLMLLTLAACGGGGDSPTDPVTPPVVPPPPVDPGTPATGIAAVAPTGLPNGVSSRVVLSNGSASHTIIGNSSVAGLAAGSWTATAQTVDADGVTYLPTPVTQTVTVTSGGSTTINVGYLPNTGSLDVAVSGLPAGGQGDIVITGPANYRRALGSSVSITALTPGTYHVEAKGVKLSAGSYAPVSAQQDVAVVAGTTASPVSVAYQLAPSVVSVAIAGLPGGAQAAVTLTPPTGSNISVTSSTRLPAALAGRWQMSAASVKSSGYTWSPTPASKDTSVASADSLTFHVNYAVSTGAIAFLVTGLEGGAQGAITVTGPGGFNRAVTATTTITDLTPGVYNVKVDSVQHAGVTYRSTTSTQQITVGASLVAAPSVIAYSSAVANLTIGVTGAPVGTTNMIEVTGPGGFNRFVSGTTTFSNVAPGQYTIVASPVIMPGGIRYEGSPTTVVRTLSFGVSDSVGITYARAGGKVAVTVLGLPMGANAAITMTGNGTTTPITGSITLDNVAPGTYTLSALPVISGGTTYNPPPSATITVTTGNTEVVSLAYSTAGTPPVGGGGTNLVVDGFYLTQATQRMDGSVPLVAGRDALLRVFVRASATNTMQPTVRVRIYDGGTLLQTLALNAPEGSVRTALAEGTLSSTWNSVITGANIRTGLRVVADVDPTDAFAESDETDNSWPRAGTPLAITVNSVPAFNVRFVPVTVGSLTGNVSTSNMNDFLVSTRRMHPIQDINATVRAPFTSTATQLQAGDGNGQWLTVLQEMNALRTADAAPSNMHYYGVVKVSYNSGVAGYGYVPGRAAMGWDYLPSGDGVAVHEWGHNFGRSHTNCGGADSPDPSYPYSGGVIGQYGWNPTTGTLIQPTATDVMGYCSNQWVSDYTWTRVMTQRASAGAVAAATMAGIKQEGLLVWGRIVNGKVTLEPAFRVTTRPTAPSATGTHHVQAVDAEGRILADLPFNAERVDHVLSRDERHFAVVLPWSDALENALATIRVSDVRQPLSVGTISSATALASAAEPAAAGRTTARSIQLPAASGNVSVVTATRSRVEWNKKNYPMAIVRDANSGEIMAFVRNPGDVIVTNGRAVEMVFSDGVRSLVQKR
ncbi:MAG: hypothetical protein ACO1Q7_13375 [Gemmatimonas sp.]